MEQHPTDFGRRLREAAENQGLTVGMLTSAELAHNLALVFHLAEGPPLLRLRHKEWTVETRDIEGVYCGIDMFPASLWEAFSAKDAEYAAQETQALWLGVLASLPCRVVNPPALDTLAGTVLSSPEILYLAHRLGFRIPTVADVESGELAAQALGKGVMATYADLGELWEQSMLRTKNELRECRNHIRILEKVRGRPVWAAVLDDQFFPSQVSLGGSIEPLPEYDLPVSIRSRLRVLQSRLNLDLAEYAFHITANGTWVFSECTRVPVHAVAAYGYQLLQKIVEAIAGKGGTSW